MTPPSEGNQGNRKVRIGLNALFLRPDRVGGGETYARGLLAGFQSLNLPYEFVVFLNKEAYPTFAQLDASPNFQRVLCPVPLNSTFRHLWEQMHFPALCRMQRLDLLHSLGNVTPFRAPCAVTATIHDIRFAVEPQTVPFFRRNLLGRMVAASARKSDLVITVSHTSEKHIIRYLGVPPEKIHVTLEGPGQALHIETPWDEVRQRYQVPMPYFLAVGIGVHKRLDRIVQAAEIVRSEHNCPANIVVTGPLGKAPPDDRMIHHLGFVPPEDLASLYKHAIALICFSDLEGFGLTALEAMNLGTPVVASNAASLPEVLGNGGIIVEHGDSAALARAMWNVATDKQLQSDLRRRGFDRVADFSWIACAAETARAYEMILRSRQLK